MANATDTPWYVDSLRDRVALGSTNGPFPAGSVDALLTAYDALLARAEAAEKERDRYMAALERITKEHINYDEVRSDGSTYGIGVVDGHRCAANVAKEALTPTPEPTREKEAK
jgi:hypothetical protein